MKYYMSILKLLSSIGLSTMVIQHLFCMKVHVRKLHLLWALSKNITSLMRQSWGISMWKREVVRHSMLPSMSARKMPVSLNLCYCVKQHWAVKQTYKGLSFTSQPNSTKDSKDCLIMSWCPRYERPQYRCSSSPSRSFTLSHSHRSDLYIYMAPHLIFHSSFPFPTRNNKLEFRKNGFRER